MTFTKLERIILSSLIVLLVGGILSLMIILADNRAANASILARISSSAKLTDKTPMNKGVYFNEEESLSKLNLNRTDLKSIKALPCLSAPLAKRVYEYVSNHQINSLDELSEVKGMTRKRLRELEKYATALGGHAGAAGWGEKVNLNFATVEDLKELPGLSKKTAEKIIEFRNQNGGFHSVDDLLEIPGLTKRVISRFADKVEVK
mgnify:CR=1 FL=1